MVRNILAVVAGLVIGGSVVFAIESIGHVMYPLPEGVDPNDMEAMKAYAAEAPEGALLMVLAAWFVGAIAAVTTSGLIARARLVCGVLVGLVFFGFAIAMLIMIPSPLWFTAATPFVYAVAIAVGMGLVSAIFPPAKRIDIAADAGSTK